MPKWLSQHAGVALATIAVILMLAGAAILIVDLEAGVGFPLVAVGLVLTALLATTKRHRHGPAAHH